MFTVLNNRVDKPIIDMDVIGAGSTLISQTLKNCRLLGGFGTIGNRIKLVGNVSQPNTLSSCLQNFGGQIYATGRVGTYTSLASYSGSTEWQSYYGGSSIRNLDFAGVLDAIVASASCSTTYVSLGFAYDLGFNISLAQTEPAAITLSTDNITDPVAGCSFSADNMTSVSGASVIMAGGADIRGVFGGIALSFNSATSIQFTAFQFAGSQIISFFVGVSLSGNACTSLNFGSDAYLGAYGSSNLFTFPSLVNFPTNMFAMYATGGIGNSYSSGFTFNTAWTAAAVNACLAWALAAEVFTPGMNCALTIGGTSAAPTGQGITDLADLVTAGWTVTTN